VLSDDIYRMLRGFDDIYILRNKRLSRLTSWVHNSSHGPVWKPWVNTLGAPISFHRFQSWHARWVKINIVRSVKNVLKINSPKVRNWTKLILDVKSPMRNELRDIHDIHAVSPQECLLGVGIEITQIGLVPIYVHKKARSNVILAVKSHEL
jgi:hypothetical protein